MKDHTLLRFFGRKITFMRLFPLPTDALNFHLLTSVGKGKHYLFFVTVDLAFSHFDGHGQYTRLSAYAVTFLSNAFVCMPF